MFNLIKVDLKRFIKDKCFIALIIIISVFALMGSSIMKIGLIFVPEDSSIYEINGLTILSTSLSPSNNIGLIMPILLITILIKDFSFGTIRNKILYGYSRTKIYLSYAIVVYTLGVLFYLFNALLNILFASLFFGFGDIENGFVTITKMLVLCTCSYLIMLSLSLFIGVLIKRIAITIVALIGLSFCVLISEAISRIEFLPKAIKNILKINPSYQITELTSLRMNTELTLIIIFSMIAYLILFILIGLIKFKKDDIK